MKLQNLKIALAVLWLVASGVAGLLVEIGSWSTLLILAGCALLPPLAMILYWNDPAPTLSQSIRSALR